MSYSMQNSISIEGYQAGHVANDSSFVVGLVLLLLNKAAEKRSIQLKDENALSEITQISHKLESEKAMLEEKLFSAWSDREVSPKEMDELLWKISDLSIAIKINKAGGLGSNSKSMDQLKASLTSLKYEVDELDALLCTIFFVSMLITH